MVAILVMLPTEISPGTDGIANVEAEALLLGALMSTHGSRFIDKVADRLRREDFCEPIHGDIYAAILREHLNGLEPNPVTLKPYFTDHQGLSDLGGVGYLGKLTGTGVGILAIDGCVDQIAKLAQRRRLQNGLKRLVNLCSDLDTDIDALLADVENVITEAGEDGFSCAKEVSAFDAIGDLMRAIEGGLAPGIRSGIDSLDHVIGSIRAGDLLIAAGRPGMGKSILGLSIARGAASQGCGVLFVTLEMSESQLSMRLAADLCFDGYSGIQFSKIEQGDLTREEFSALARAREQMRDLPLVFVDRPSIRVGQLSTLIRRQARRMAARGAKLGLVVVDYLQLMEADQQNASRTAEVTQISRGLKLAAKANGVGIVALAQVSRKVEDREDKRPRLADLRESGSIEQDADAVVFLYRPDYYLLQSEPSKTDSRRTKWEAALAECRGHIEFICAKRRQGETGISRGRFWGAFQAVRT